jgi:hypothetical protein
VLALVVIQTIVVALLGLLVVSLLRSHAAILRRLHDAGFGLEDDHDQPRSPGPVPVPLRTRDGVPEPGVGAAVVANVTGTTTKGSAVSVSVSGPRPTLLAFLTTGCTTCTEFWQAFADGVDLPGGIRLVIVTKGDEADDAHAVAALAPRGATVIRSSAAWVDYSVPGSPYFVLVADGRVRGEGAALRWEQVRDLLGRAVEPAASATRRARSQRARIQDTDEELLAAGLRPGDPSLYPSDPAVGPGAR